MRLGLILRLFRRSAHIQKKRMAMTVAAIAWGTLSIVLLLSFGEGMKRNFTKRQQGARRGIVVVWPGATAKAFAGFPQGRNLRFVEEDVRPAARPTSPRSAAPRPSCGAGATRSPTAGRR